MKFERGKKEIEQVEKYSYPGYMLKENTREEEHIESVTWETNTGIERVRSMTGLFIETIGN